MAYKEGIGELIDKLCVVNMKIWAAESGIREAMDEKPRDDKKVADLNDKRLKAVNRRRDLINKLNALFDKDFVEEVRFH